MAVPLAIPIATTVGEFAAPYLIRKAGKLGIKKFIETYGSTAWQSIAGVTGGMIAQLTEPVDLQTEKILGMPVRHITGQGEVYSDIDYSAIDEDREVEPLKYIDTVHGGKGPLKPIKAKPFPAETEVKKWDESFKAPEPIETTKGLEIPPQEIKIPPGFETPKTVDTSILTQDKPKDITKQTEELVPKIKNKITTWEDHFPTIEEATKAAKDVGGTLREFEEGVLYKKITFRQHSYGFDIYFDKKLIGGLNDVDPYKEDPNRKGNQKSYNLNYINEEGRDDEAFTTINGQKYAKEKAKELIARDLLRETEESTDPLYPTSPSLRDIFQNLEYNKKGEPKDVAEGIEKTLKELEEHKEKKALTSKDDTSQQTKDLVTKEPEFGALTEVEKQTALLEKEGKPDFYSRAIKSIEDAKPNKLTKTKWKSYIQSTKEELDYLGLTEFLKGNESVTKKELLDFVKGKDIAATMVVRSVPKDQMNPMWVDYSLGGEQQEHIVFQTDMPERRDVHGTEILSSEKHFLSSHFNREYGTDNFAWARTQVGYDKLDTLAHTYEDEHERIKKNEKIFKNTLIIDEIQSDWIQKGQDEGFVSDWKILKGSELTEKFLEDNFPGKYKLRKANPEERQKILENQRILEEQGFDKILLVKNTAGQWRDWRGIALNQYQIFNKNSFHTWEAHTPNNLSKEAAEAEVAKYAVPDLPLKDSKKFVELVLNEMIRKAVKDGRDSIAITNGQIQYNRYEAMEEKERQGLKKFYDTFVYDQLNKIAKNYGVKLERIDIQDPEQVAFDLEQDQIKFPRKVKEAQDNDLYLQKITLQELWDRIKDTNIPGHTPLYSNQGRGQGVDYIENYINQLVDNFYDGSNEERNWEKIKHNEVYVWKVPTSNIDEEGTISWDMPIVPVADTLTNPAVKDLLNASKEDREYIIRQFTIGGAAAYPYDGENINNTDLIKYTEYLRNYKPPEGVDLGYDKDIEQLIKMKLPKKLQNDILKKSIRLTKVEQQTDRMFG